MCIRLGLRLSMRLGLRENVLRLCVVVVLRLRCRMRERVVSLRCDMRMGRRGKRLRL